jgi:predicted TIM-barrel fold metal-dependent hydrolase
MQGRHARIDVHQHLVPGFYRDWLAGKGVGEAGGRALPAWTPEQALRVMDTHEIDIAVLSLSTPGTWFGDPREAAAMAQRVNEFAARLAASGTRFGFFATVPLPDIDSAVKAATRALDDLGADGVCLLANNAGRYLGDPAEDELFAALDERRAVVFVHPSSLPGGGVVAGIPPFAADFLLDTTRAAMNLVLHDIPRRFPRLKIILSHAGGFLPYAAHRIAAGLIEPARRDPLSLLEDLAGFYFDTALSGSPTALPSLLAFAKPGHVLYGSDWPFAPDPAVAWFTAGLDQFHQLDAEAHAAIDRRNAQCLFPRLADQESRP